VNQTGRFNFVEASASSPQALKRLIYVQYLGMQIILTLALSSSIK
jgi:hypothetical protein